MTSMQERADRIGASLTIVTAPRSGTEVVLAWEPPSFAIPELLAEGAAGEPLSSRMPLGARTSATAQATVLVVDDHALVRTGVANIISHEPDLHVVAEAANGRRGGGRLRAAIVRT